MMRLLSIAIVAGLTFAGTASAWADPIRYRCTNRQSLDAVFTNGAYGGGVAELHALRGGTIVLPQVISADGGRYADAGSEFWIKGANAWLTRSGRTVACRAIY